MIKNSRERVLKESEGVILHPPYQPPLGEIWQCLETFLMVMTGVGEKQCCGHQMGRNQGCC